MLAGRPAGRRYGRRIHVLHLTDRELGELLCSPFAETELVRSDGIVVAIASPHDSEVHAVALERLASLPCVVVGHGHSPADRPPYVDVVVDDAVAPVDVLLAAIEVNPIASVTLAMALRGAENRSLGQGLVAESAAYSLLQAGPEFQRWLASRPRRERPPQTEPPVLVHRAGHRLELTLNRPHVRNALDVTMRDALLEALAVPAADPTVTDIHLRGAGPVFCSGGDLDEFGAFADPASAHLVRLATSVGRAIDAVGGRVTAHLHGHCAGSGIELPAFARTVVAAPDTTLSLPETGLGLIPGAGGTVSLTRRAGRHRVALLALSGAAIDAATAAMWGLVDSIEG